MGMPAACALCSLSRRLEWSSNTLGDSAMRHAWVLLAQVKVEGGVAMLDYPKERKPMETAQAIFEKKVKEQGLAISAMEAELSGNLTNQKFESLSTLKTKYETEEVSQGFKVASVIADPHKKVDAALDFASAKQHADEVKWMTGMIKKQKQEATKKDKEDRLAALQASKKSSGPAGTIIMSRYVFLVATEHLL